MHNRAIESRNAPEPTMTYLTAQRLASLKQYLEEVEAGVDTVKAWNAHRARMAA